MANVVDHVSMNEEGVEYAAADVTYDNVTGAISQVAWSNTTNPPRDLTFIIKQPGKTDVTVVLQANKTGTRRNITGYNYLQCTIELR